MDYGDYLNIFEDIPSGEESEDDLEFDGTDDIDVQNMHDNKIVIEDIIDIVDMNDSGDNGSIMYGNDDGEYSAEENIPLSQVRADLLAKKFIWRNIVSTFREPGNFSENCGPCNIPEEAVLPVDIFLCLFPNVLFEHIVYETNLYATQANACTGKSFIPTNVNEMKSFFAINIIMGIKRLPSYRDFWSTKLELRDAYVSNVMPRTRFDWLLGNIHLNNNILQPDRGHPDYDKLFKVRPLLTKLAETFANYYKPSRIISIDESMIRFKGRSSLRQYMPNKPIKRGYKVWVRADAHGYVDEFQLYTGKVGNIAEKNLGARVVTDMTRSLVNKNFIVYFDNYFTSLPLLRQLKLENIHACGTVRKDRKELPTNMKEDKTMKRGESDWRITDDGIVSLKWVDKRIVRLASNFHNPELPTGTVERKKKNGEKENITCPMMVIDYNSHMGYVDKADMMKNTYEIDRKSRKWWHRILWHFLDVTIVNSFIIFTQRTESRSLDLKTFRLSVVSGLIGAAPETPRRGRPSGEMPVNKFKPQVPLEKRWDQASHMPIHSTSRRCALCSSKAEQHRTRWSCSTCKIGLCLSEKKKFFIKYHSKNY